MVRFIPAEELKEQYDVFGHLYSVQVARPAIGHGLNVDDLCAAKALIHKVGSVELAQEALAAMKKLG